MVIGCDTHGRKHCLAIEEGFRESTESWKALLLSVRDRGLKVAPTLAIGDGAMGVWTAMAAVFPTTRSQRCWVHKTLHSQATSALHAIGQAEIKDQADKAFDRFIATYEAQYPKATGCLAKERDE